MKKWIQLFLALVLMTGLSLCSETPDDMEAPIEEQTDEQEDVLDSVPDSSDEEADDSKATNTVLDAETANKITENLVIDDKVILPGDLPNNIKNGESILEDLKFDTDTLFYIDGLTKRVRVRKSPNRSLPTFLARVVGSDFYIQGSFQEAGKQQKEEEEDTLAILNFGLETTDLELPLNFDLEILPQDSEGTVVDTTSIDVGIEDTNGNCNFKPDDSVLWEWIATIQDKTFYLAPMYPQITSGSVLGCCENGISSYTVNCKTSSQRSVDYETIFTVELEYLKFYSHGHLGGELFQYTQNLDVGNTDFCGGNAGYMRRNTYNIYNGKYTFNPDCSLTIDSIEGLTDAIYAPNGDFIADVPRPVYVGTSPASQYEFLSPHFLKETRSVDATLERIYERRTNTLKWYD
ncbi:hypothetical protein SAMN04488513_106130 [Pseudozobellia thermophila]|uniref:Uncharacterized protein n=2 Tax=Pseudozobellia thermophila TaxID=192903 RepID=A0A1M6KNA6_9FLAO|nr:hypothetical protein SAMN04488513_106130 [Pseudozobellia thermophila]